MVKRLLSLLVLCCASAAAAQAPPEIHFVPVFPTVSDRVTVLVEGTGCARHRGRTEFVNGHITLDAEDIPGVPCGPGRWAFEYPAGRLPEGRYVVTVEVDGEPAAEREIVVAPSPLEEIALNLSAGNLGSQFTAGLEWSFPGEAVPRRARAVDVSPQAGYFWFSSPDNPEVTLKIVDGSAINGRGWLFVSALTTLPFKLTLTSCLPNVSPPLCRTSTYDHPGGEQGGLIVDLGVE